MTKTTLYTISEVARMLKKQPYQIVYVLGTGKVPEPKVRIGNRRAFDGGDIKRLQHHFCRNGKGGRDRFPPPGRARSDPA